MNAEQKDLLNNLARIPHVNEQVEKLSNSQNIQDAQIQHDFNLLKNIVENHAVKIPQSMYVYKELTAHEVGLTKQILQEQTHQIDKEQYTAFQKEFQYGISRSFMLTNLSPLHQDHADAPLILKLEIPRGTPLTYVTENTMMLPQDQGIEIVKKTVITDQQGKEKIQLEGKIVSKQEIVQKIKNVETALNTQFKQLINSNHALVTFEIDGFYASSMLSRSETMIKEVTQNIPNALLIHCLTQMNPNGALFFTDKPLDNYIEHVDNSRSGLYDPATQRIYLQVNNLSHIEEKGQDLSTILSTFGYAIDYLGKEHVTLSQTAEFKAIYEAEKDNLKSANAQEFFTHAVRDMFANDMQLRNEVQQMVRNCIPISIIIPLNF
ncbi:MULTISPECIES: ADP-ribosyltransferase [Bacillus cereus group]|uniref:ADP-ribosyltransferase n=1 Tax=Bacillus cereus group TaxID=86661 RepID=UPI000D84012E|nr:ADP-ribosyltransferase [Bacillus cereus]SPT76334.1 anthrax lethal factor endopeptidase [Bacillus cereus]